MLWVVVTATEFKTNLSKYLNKLLSEDIFITQDGKMVAKMVNPNVSAVESISGLLSGKLPDDFDAKMLREGKSMTGLSGMIQELTEAVARQGT